MKHFIYHRTGFLPPSNERRGEGFAYNRLSKAWLLAFVSVIYSLIHSFAHLAYGQLTLGSGVVNSYQRVSAVSGATITLSGTATGAAHTLAAGDRVLLVQMTGNTSANGGKFEFGTVASATGTSVTLTTSTTRAYSPSSEKVQLVWVPYNATSITVPAGGIVAKKWDGTTGGIVAVLTPGTLTLNGTINADGAGFRYADGTNTINGNDIYYGGGGGGSTNAGGGGGGGYGSPGKAASVVLKSTTLGGEKPSEDGTLNGGYPALHYEYGPNAFAGGGGGAGVGGAGAGGGGPMHGGGGGGGAGYAGGGNGGSASDTKVSNTPVGKGSVGATGDTDGGNKISDNLDAYNGAGGGGNQYVGGGGGGKDMVSGLNGRTSNVGGKSGTNGGAGGISIAPIFDLPSSGGNGGGTTPTAFNQYQYCDATFFCPDTRIWMAGGGQLTVQGGGIVMVSAASIVANNKTISSNGDNGITITNDGSLGGTGGGGGGLLVVNTQAITAGPLTLCAKGGQGGKARTDVYHGGGGGGGGGGGLVWVQDPQGGVANNSTGAPPAVANITFCVDGGPMAVLTTNPKNANYTGIGGAGGPGGIQANNPCAVFGACGAGSIGDYVWKDSNNNGVQDSGELPVQGVRVQLLQGTTVLATDTTDASGLYLFPNLASGTYQVKILTASLPSGCVLSTMQNQGGDDAKDSDFDPTTGLSQTITIDAAGTGIAKDNLTIDGALYSPKFDLALTKTLAAGQTTTVKPGDKVSFTITVYNQGEVAASQIQVSDYIPTGFVFNAADNAAWTLSGTTTLPGTLAAGASTTINIVLQVASTYTGTGLVNKAEISSAKDGSGNSVTDIDSTPDQNPANDAGGKEGSGSDDAIGGTGTGTPGGTDPATDEDDADPVLVIVSQCKIPNCLDNNLFIVR